ncbi:uracil-DNA glycosylase [Vagococcus salmoninarum]|uniref:uracil-DNA glycosylase n=1 Tax=Vagococcus salmoninarum TaxID=2739 RepID=UPI003F9B8AD2
MRVTIGNQWQKLFLTESQKPYFSQLQKFVEKEYQEKSIYPEQENIFKAFEWTSYEEVKVVILGQDPYHGANQAHGLSFSVLPGNKIPPSLRNIYQELASDLGTEPVTHGYLESWAKEGVLLLNTVLTVAEGQAHSHRNQGWEIFTDQVIYELNQRKEPIVFILWGKPAQSKIKMIDQERHHIIQGPHPSPLSAYRGFFGTKPFSEANRLLRENGQKEIMWQLPITV